MKAVILLTDALGVLKGGSAMIREAKDSVVATISNATVMNWVIACLSTATLTLAGFCTYYVMEIRATAAANASAIAASSERISENDKRIAVLSERQLWWSTTADQLRSEMKDLKSAISKLDDKLDSSNMK